MIRAIIVDDESHIRDEIREKIAAFYAEDIIIISEADSKANAIHAIEELEPQLVFMDVNLGDGTGFDVIQESSYKDFGLIFITGFDNHAIKAIKIGALDYILKPVDNDEFKEAVNKAIDHDSKGHQLEKLIEVSSEFFKGAKDRRVILKTADTVYAVYENDIIYCRSDGNYTTFYTQQMEKIVVSKSIKKVEEILSEDVFIRCHQSYIVNKKHVLKYNKNGVLIVNLDFKIPVSSRRKDYTLKKIFE